MLGDSGQALFPEWSEAESKDLGGFITSVADTRTRAWVDLASKNVVWREVSPLRFAAVEKLDSA